MGSANLRRGCLSWASGPRVIQPSIIKDIGRVIELLRARGNMAILLVEQYFDFARGSAQNIAVMERGNIVLADARDEIDEEDVRRRPSV